MFHASLGKVQKAITVVGCICAAYGTFVCLYYAGHLIALVWNSGTVFSYDAVAFTIIFLACGFMARMGLGLATLYPSFKLEQYGIRLRFLRLWETRLYWAEISEVFLPASQPGAIALTFSSTSRAPWKVENLPMYRVNGTLVQRAKPVLLLFPSPAETAAILARLETELSASPPSSLHPV